MPLFTGLKLGFGKAFAVVAAGGGYQIEKSLRFDRPSTSYLNRTLTDSGSGTTGTYSFWVKRNDMGVSERLVCVGNYQVGSGYPTFYIAFNSSTEKLQVYCNYNGQKLNISTDAVFRDYSAWYHIVVKIDTTQVTNTDRATIYVNNVEQSVTATTWPSQNDNVLINLDTHPSYIGCRESLAELFSGYLADYHFIDGTALDATDFGEFNEDTGVWDPKKYAGTYGTNGFYLKFNNTSDLGEDSSGNGNDWTATNLSTTAGAGNDSLTDTPTNYGDDSGLGGEVRGNYATLNPLHNGPNATLSNGNLQLVNTSTWGTTISTIGMSSGKWYAEVTLSGTIGNPAFGVSSIDGAYVTSYLGKDADSYVWFAYTGAGLYTAAAYTNQTGDWVVDCVAGDVIGLALDMDNGTLKYYKDGTLLGGGNAFTGITGTQFFATCGYVQTENWNFGQHAFAYPLSGYKALCTQNLTDPTIEDPSKHFEVKTYSGTGLSNPQTGLEFEPGLTWIKRRNQSTAHFITDAVRTAGIQLDSASTDDEDSQTSRFVSFDSGGFTVGSTHETTNESGGTYVAWNWNAGTANTSVSVGDLNSTAYDQSQTWSTNSTVNSISGTFAASTIFDGNESTSIRPTSDTSNYNGSTTDEYLLRVASLNFSNVSSIKLKLAGNSESSASIWFNDDLATKQALTLTGSSGSNSIVEINSGIPSSLSSISISGPNATGSSFGVSFYFMKIDGKTLVDSGVTPSTDFPSLASTYRANPTAGFSIVSYTGSGTSGDNVAHGLNDKPQLILTKNRDNNDYWAVYHTSLTSGYALQLDDDTDEFAGSQIYTSTAPTSSSFTVGSNDAVNASLEKYISYCWSEVAGYSKFGGYTGNGTDGDGPFVECGFKPRFIMLKRTDNSAHWIMYDTARDTYNEMSKSLYASDTVIETYLSNDEIDVLSNGFKLRSDSGEVNKSDTATYIFAAFAEHPFKHSRAQ